MPSKIGCVLLSILGVWSCKPSQDYEQASTALRRGEFSQVIELSERNLKAHAKSSSPDGYRDVQWRQLEADALLNRDGNGDPERARLLLALPLRADQDAGPLGVVRRRLVAYDALHSQGDVKTTDAVLTEAEQLASSLSLQTELAAVRLLQGRLLVRKDPESAERKTREARQIAVASGDKYHEAASLLTLGMFRINRFRFDEAIPFFQDAQAAAAKGSAQPIIQAALINLGLCYSFLGDFDEASAHFEQARQRLSQSETVGKWSSLWGELANVHMHQNNPEKAIPLYRQALSLARGIDDKSLWARNLTAALIANRNWEEADKVNAEVPRLTSESAVVAKLNQASIASGRGRYDEGIRLFLECIRAGTPAPEDLWEAHAGLAAIYEKVGDRKSANLHFEKALSQIELTVSQVSDDDIHRMTYLSRLISFYQDYVNSLVEQGENARALRVAESSRAHILASRLEFERAQKSSSSVLAYQKIARVSKSIVLSYWLAPAESYLWVIASDRVQLFRLPAAPQIEDLVRRYQEELVTKKLDPMAKESMAGRRLFDTLVGPAQAMIPLGSPVTIVADGALHFLNFETLPVYGTDPQHYWIDDVVVSNAPSLDLLASGAPARAKNEGSMLVIGDAQSYDPQFPKLANSAGEIHNVLGHFSAREKRALTDSGATPESYRSSDPGRFSIIHFSAHAVANQRRPLESFIALSRSGDNFKLYARDVMRIPLSADLVTISACHGAGARSYAGEGLVGFVWAFMHAGARRVIAGLWEATDDLMPQMMNTLYREMESGNSPAQALRTAKLAMVHGQGASKKPWYWGPFQVYVR